MGGVGGGESFDWALSLRCLSALGGGGGAKERVGCVLERAHPSWGGGLGDDFLLGLCVYL